ncbi:FAD/FMN-containing dehydrogenase [Cupriavidus agavae]|uniref:FAD/FMN-containing dehydrogenase n=2 Tax=Cupriavidus agavae TaxID=1001822 RepID=A0A4V2FHA5_9BURK|nr:FAD-binding oxidoreductase [Cupriavidus agavae]RZT39599.1 FAD/FMN-containing dehydrogenase [Cupriavidus agavae]
MTLPPNPEALLQAMQAIVGPTGCLSAAADTEPFVTDYRRIYHGKSPLVVLPATTEQVSQVMAWCYAHDVPVVPQGGNTSLMGGAVPDDSGTAIVISLKRMNRVLAIDTVNDTMTLEAGVTLSAARAAAEDSRRLFPLRIGSEGSCQIGGNLSTNAGGTAVLRYGNMRDLVLGIEVVLPDGRIFSSLKGLRKDNTGYDLKHLFVGAEGTLGIITGAVLKLMPQPRATSVAFVAVQNPDAAVKLLGEARALSGQAVTAFELISAPALDLVLGYLGDVPSPLEGRHDWMVLIELTSGTDEESLNATLMQILEAGLEQQWVVDAAVASSLADVQQFWRIREEISDAQTRTGGSIKCDVSVPLSRVAPFIEQASAAVLALEPATRMVIYGHMGDGNVHFNPLRPAERDAKDFLAQWYKPVSDLVDGLAHAENGSISAEHGIGVAKRDDLTKYKSAVELELMWQVKRALDPKNLLNPGRVLPRID